MLKVVEAFSHIFEGMVWRVMHAPFTDALLLELRDGDTRTASFACVDLNTGFLRWQTAPDVHAWWQGMLKVHGGHLFLHGYKDPQFPEHKGIICLSVLDGKLLWQRDDLTYCRMTSSGLIAASQEHDTEVYQLVDATTGSILERVDIAQVDAGLLTGSNGTISDAGPQEQQNTFAQRTIRGLSESSNSGTGMVYPLFYKEGSRHFDTVAAFLAMHGYEPQLAIEYLEMAQCVLCSFYEREDGKLVNRLLVTDMEGEKVYEHLLAGGLDGIGADTFFLIKERPIFIRDKKEIVILRLN